MSTIKRAILIVLGTVVIGAMAVFAATTVTDMELHWYEESVEASHYGLYGYGTYYNTSPSGSGNILCKFQVNVAGLWIPYGSQQIAPNSSCELGGHGNPSGSLVYNYKIIMSAVQNDDWGVHGRTGEGYLTTTNPTN